MKISGIALISLSVADQQAAKAFYAEKLGFEVRRDNPMGPDQQWIEVAPPGAKTALTLVTWFPDMPPGSVQGMVLETDDVVAAHASLQASGVVVSAIEAAPWGQLRG